MSQKPPLKATIMADLDNLPDALAAAGFRPGDRVRALVEYLDEESVLPPGVSLIEVEGQTILTGVTIETAADALRAIGIGEDKKFTLILRQGGDDPVIELR